MRQIYEKYIPIIKEGLESEYKIIGINLPQWFGKTTYSWIYCVNNNKNNAIYVNNHALKFEIYKKLITGKFHKQINVPVLPNITYGKFKIISDEERFFSNYPPCACYLFEHNRYLWELMRLGFLPSNYCKKKCVYRYDCLHKQLNKDIFNTLKSNYFHKINILMKSHIDTELPSTYLEKAENSYHIIDENPFNITYKENQFNGNIIENFRDKIGDLIYNNEIKEIYDIWNDFDKLLMNLKEYIIHKKSLKDEEKEKKKSLRTKVRF